MKRTTITIENDLDGLSTMVATIVALENFGLTAIVRIESDTITIEVE